MLCHLPGVDDANSVITNHVAVLVFRKHFTASLRQTANTRDKTTDKAPMMFLYRLDSKQLHTSTAHFKNSKNIRQQQT